jgi:hypothetical protein
LLAEVLLQIRANKSQGTSADIVAVATLAAQGDNIPVYYVVPHATFVVQLSDIETALISTPNNFVHYLNLAKSAGTRGLFIYSTWVDGNDFSWTSVSDPLVGEAGWSSVSDSAVGGLLMACEDTL